MDRDQVLAAFARDYGTQAILARPIDKGFNRLAWLVPVSRRRRRAPVAAVVIARRWSRRAGRRRQPAAPQDDAALRTRLDDELRDLD